MPTETLPQRSPPPTNIEPPDPHHDGNEAHDRPYLTSLQQRQQQAAEFYRTQHHSRSSSSASATRTLRRSPTPRLSPRVRFHSPALFPPGRAELFAPHPALRVSRRTAEAVRFVLEEALRTPYAFTPDLFEEGASMAEIAGVRAANGNARTQGPVPVSQSDRSNIRTPQMIMNQRREREARRQQTEAEARQAAEEQRKAEEERRRSAERRAQAAGVAGATNPSAPATQRQQAHQPPLRTGDGQHSSTAGVLRQPERTTTTSANTMQASAQPPSLQDTSAGAQYGRSRTSSQAPRPTSYESGASQQARPTQAQHARRPSNQQAQSTGAAQPPPTSQASRQSTTSSFPHAFERWETLSSHWEGLTSYWIRRLEQNTEEVRREPLAQQMSRQITDLSAAGANLFHAVVELQRLRASSERKFQRWFYEHRQEQERAREREAQLDGMIRAEREARQEAVTNMERMVTEKKNAERMVVEMRRELQISKEEARRAWEELGRREQEERDRAFSLREGQPTIVCGVQVVPTTQGMGMGQPLASPQAQAGAEYSAAYGEPQSPTDTDPFTENTRHRREGSDIPPIPQTYVPSGATTSAPTSTIRPVISSPPVTDSPQIPAPLQLQQRTGTSGAQPPSRTATSQPEAFYQQPEAYLHRDTTSTIPEDERSYVTSNAEVTSDGDEEYAIDSYGNFILDDAGHRVPYRALRPGADSDILSDEYDVEEDRRRELEHLQRYGAIPGTASGFPAGTSSAGPESQNWATSGIPDYSGAGYGSEWAGMRHHHPTRLSDVLEEDERSRTSPISVSRASQASRGQRY